MKPVEWFSREVTKHVRPVIRDYLIQVYETPENYLEPDQKEATNQLIKFQLALKKIPNWTNTQIKKQIDDIAVRCPGFKKLLVALFVSYIKMISDGIRTTTKSRRLDVKLPSDETFIHTCFIDCAHNLYEDPYVMKKSEHERNRELDSRLQECIMNSIDKLIPTMDIINNYIPATNDEVCFSTNKDDEENELGENEPEIPTTELKKEENTENETQKVIQTTEPLPQPPTSTEIKGGEGEDDDLFPDAPDKISSKE